MDRWIPLASLRRSAGTPDGRIQFALRVGTSPMSPVGVVGAKPGPMTLSRDGARVTLSGPGRLGGVVDLDSLVGEVWAPMDDQTDTWRAMHTHLRLLWSLALARCGLHPVHASAVVVGEAAVVIVGPSGAGKSTLAARLALAGARFLSDDTIYAAEGTGQVAGLGDTCRLRDSNLLTPDLLDPDPDGKHVSHPGTAIATLAKPRILLFLDSSYRAKIECRPLRPSEAMVELMRSGLLNVDPPTAGARMRTLGQLAEVCPSFRVSRGPEQPSAHMLNTWMEMATT